MTNIQIPAGLLDNHIELFTVQGKVMATHAGVVQHLFELPIDFLTLLKKEMNASSATIQALEYAGFKTEKQKIEKFADCKFGGFDFTADFADGKFSDNEYHECGYRGSCPMEGIVCGFYKINDQIITPFEIDMIKLLATEDTTPVIAEKLKVSMNTLETKKQKLFEKLGVLSRPKLVSVAYHHQILK